MENIFCAEMHVKANKNPMDELLKQAKAWFNEIRSIDIASFHSAITLTMLQQKALLAMFG